MNEFEIICYKVITTYGYNRSIESCLHKRLIVGDGLIKNVEALIIKISRK